MVGKTMPKTKTPYLFQPQLFKEARGSLGVIEKDNLPFDVKRIYYLYDIPDGGARGAHGHIQLEQIFLCFGGELDVHCKLSAPYGHVGLIC